MDEDQHLLDLNRRLFETQILEQDPALLLFMSSDSYVVIAPGGVVESRDQAMAGLRAFVDVDSLTLENECVIREGETADDHGIPSSRLRGMACGVSSFDHSQSDGGLEGDVLSPGGPAESA